MTSSSSDEEDLNKLREAVDPEFINDGMFNDSKRLEDSTITKDKPQIPSLRPIKDDQAQFNVLNVTPTFQNYVAGKLGELLKRKLRKKLVSNIEYRNKEKRCETGIKLFSDSKDFAILSDESDLKRKKIEIKSRTVENDCVDDEVKVRLCAIKPEDVLRGKGTEYWTERRKSEVFSYKQMSNGQLVEITKEFK